MNVLGFVIVDWLPVGSINVLEGLFYQRELAAQSATHLNEVAAETGYKGSFTVAEVHHEEVAW